MNLRFRIPLTLFAVVCTSTLARADESLLDRTKARELTTREQAIFGPKSAGVSYDPRMIRAAEIAAQRAHPKTTWYCWRYVKDALLAAKVVSSRPTTAWAKHAGDELCRKFGFIKLNIRDPRKAPVGAVIVYGGEDAGHVELRTEKGFVSDFISRTPYPRPLVGVFMKRS